MRRASSGDKLSLLLEGAQDIRGICSDKENRCQLRDEVGWKGERICV